MLDMACSRQHRHTAQFLWRGDFASGSNYAPVHILPLFSVGDPASANQARILAPIQVDIFFSLGFLGVSVLILVGFLPRYQPDVAPRQGTCCWLLTHWALWHTENRPSCSNTFSVTMHPTALLCVALTFHNEATVHANDDCQSTYERTLRGLRCCCCLLFTLYVSLPFHFRFTLIFSHCLAYRGDRCALVLVMPTRLRDAISGILAGGIPGFGTATFLLGTSRSSC